MWSPPPLVYYEYSPISHDVTGLQSPMSQSRGFQCPEALRYVVNWLLEVVSAAGHRYMYIVEEERVGGWAWPLHIAEVRSRVTSDCLRSFINQNTSHSTPPSSPSPSLSPSKNVSLLLSNHNIATTNWRRKAQGNLNKLFAFLHWPSCGLACVWRVCGHAYTCANLSQYPV